MSRFHDACVTPKHINMAASMAAEIRLITRSEPGHRNLRSLKIRPLIIGQERRLKSTNKILFPAENTTVSTIVLPQPQNYSKCMAKLNFR